MIFLRELFDLELEVSIPTWYAQTQLFVAAIIAALIALHYYRASKSGQARWWGLTSGLVILLSIDEGGGIHEQLINIIKSSSEAAGITVNSWVIYVSLVVIAVGVLFLKFFLSLPRRTQVLLVMSATIFIFGAFFLDMIGGGYVDNTKLHKLFFVPAEEGMELLGAALLFFTFADYAKNSKVKVLTSFTS